MSRFLIAAAHKSSGKTVISTGLASALQARGKAVQCFKKGPDYIDPMWLAAASARPCYNLDFNTMPEAELLALFTSRAETADLALIEANKGLYDGVDVEGCDSNAHLAKLLQAPVILVVDTIGMTRGIAPLLIGYQAFDAGVNIAGLILNKVGGARHEGKLRAAVEAYTDIPVIGSVWRNPALNIGERHLGLTTPAESGELEDMIAGFGDIVGGSVDLDVLQEISGTAPALPRTTIRGLASAGRSRLKAGTARDLEEPQPASSSKIPATDLRIGIATDTAFGFYYPDDLEAFAAAGAELVPINTLSDPHLPDVDGLFIGGGFPETSMQALSDNVSLRTDIRQAIASGLPTYAECGGLMYLCRSLEWNGARSEMVGAIDGDAIMCKRPQGRGYARLGTTGASPWGGSEIPIPAHEFHYAKIDNLSGGTVFARTVLRGHGTDGKSDGIISHNLLAGFCHLRNTASNPWVGQFVEFTRSKRAEKGR